MYSAYTNYTVHSIPLYVIRIVNTLQFVLIAWYWMRIDLSVGEITSLALLFVDFALFMFLLNNAMLLCLQVQMDL